MAIRILLTLLSVLALAGTGVGQTGRDPIKADNARFGDPTSIARAYQDFLYGVIKEIKKDELVLEKTKFGIDQALKLKAKTKYIHDGKPGSLDRLKVGDKVWVDVKTEKKTGVMIATKVVTGVSPTGSP
ncbi:MAG: hypothetical protein HYS33_01130 [Acidobacteria bacterium]|nr:hypothetical protein [Acidobacteriota bacterium]MBI1984198.1 hypothetical protein [Acidobacteriota bacterium]